MVVKKCFYKTTKLVNKVSHQIETQLPDFVRSDHQLFASFVEDYFQFLESAKVTLDFTTDYVILEPETKGYLLSENGILGAAVDRIVLESSTEYTPGEIVKGSRSGAEAKVIVEDVRKQTKKQLFFYGDEVVAFEPTEFKSKNFTDFESQFNKKYLVK